MKRLKLMSLLAALTVTVSVLAGCGAKGGAEGAKDQSASSKSVKITLLNSKGEIQSQLEDAAKAFSKDNPNITLEILTCATGESPFQKESSMYAAGNAPTLAMLDPNDIPKFKDKFLDLSNEKWTKDAIEAAMLPTKQDGKIVAFPLALEGYGLIYNKAVLDKAGVDPASVKTTKDLEEAFKKVQAAGTTPMVLSPMDWSLGAHLFPIAYMDQAKDVSGDQFAAQLKAGKVDLKNNAVFNNLMATFDVMKANNIDKKDPLAGTYEKAPEYLGKGEVAFWFMGNWAWPQIKDFDKSNGQYGFMPVPVSNNAEDYGNSQIYAGTSKCIGIDKVNNSADQQAAAKKFLEWLVYNEAGQDVLVNKCSLVPAFSNIKAEIKDPLGKSLKQYLDNKKVIQTPITLPGDHWAKVGGAMQKYLAGKSDKAGFAADVENYWKSVK